MNLKEVAERIGKENNLIDLIENQISTLADVRNDLINKKEKQEKALNDFISDFDVLSGIFSDSSPFYNLIYRLSEFEYDLSQIQLNKKLIFCMRFDLDLSDYIAKFSPDIKMLENNPFSMTSLDNSEVNYQTLEYVGQFDEKGELKIPLKCMLYFSRYLNDKTHKFVLRTNEADLNSASIEYIDFDDKILDKSAVEKHMTKVNLISDAYLSGKKPLYPMENRGS